MDIPTDCKINMVAFFLKLLNNNHTLQKAPAIIGKYQTALTHPMNCSTKVVYFYPKE